MSIVRKETTDIRSGKEIETMTDMKRFFILRGAPASGKSTWIARNGLESVTVSSDEIRIRLFGIGEDEDGRPCIPQRGQSRVWACVRSDIEALMASGSASVVLDSTALRSRDMRAYEDLCSAYGYSPVVVDFTGVGREECHRRNAAREEFRRVPDFVIDRYYDRLPGCRVPSGYEVISPDEAVEEVRG